MTKRVHRMDLEPLAKTLDHISDQMVLVRMDLEQRRSSADTPMEADDGFVLVGSVRGFSRADPRRAVVPVEAEPIEPMEMRRAQ